MSTPGTPDHPLHVAVVGSGPSGFYVVQGLLQSDLDVRVDVFDRLPTPYGLVRYGVAPDHQKIKNVAKVYERLADDERVRFFGNVGVGQDLPLETMQRHYHMIAFCTGAQSDRKLGIPGEDLEGSQPATAFVAWYNGHPEFRDVGFHLDAERAVVVGVGNVAIDVARMLVHTEEELRETDVADDALEALANSNVKEVVVLGRRGPAQAAFTNKELEELAHLAGADVVVQEDEATLDDLSREELEQNPDRQTQRKVEMLQGYAAKAPEGRSRRLVLRFLVSPTEILGDEDGRVRAVRIVRNELYRDEKRGLRPRATEATEEIPCGLVLRSVGYRGVEIPGVPWRKDWGIIPNDEGRVLDAPDGQQVTGYYVAGWIKRGPSGVIGTNRPDALETVQRMAEDAAAGRHFEAPEAGPEAIDEVLRTAGVRWLTFDDWKRLDRLEVERGSAEGRPRHKFLTKEEMFEALEGSAAEA